ncbi:heterogeneous nuclear ribonucleoprotein U-like protein 1 [Copidosoma floridanum]|uniref:heterogeneous nuclear ribonucleoprotein U-like protein 1 n=1 Tax=Copidosoma floridanum TaxID=29053 RepID=UPI0006C9599B|nr:heterogeneous nuclear ribonucleoprotein U-like protein 1 [Copidosoma floridanum]
MDPAKLKVVELRVELMKRGLDSKGNKPILIERLRQAIQEERASGEAPTVDLNEKSEIGSESEEDSSDTVKLPPRTPSRSSRHTSREPTTPVKTPTRRSSSRSSLSRQSPAKAILIEGNEATPTLEPIIEEDKPSPMKGTVVPEKDIVVTISSKKDPEALPKKESASTPKKDVTPVPCLGSPGQESTPVFTSAPSPSPKEAVETSFSPSSPAKKAIPQKKANLIDSKTENAAQNELQKKDECLDVVQEAEKHISEKSQEITRVSAEELCQKPDNTIAESNLMKAIIQNPIQTFTEGPIKIPAQKTTKTDIQCPVKSQSDSQLIPTTTSLAKQVLTSTVKLSTESSEDTEDQRPAQLSSSLKLQQSPVKCNTESLKSHNKNFQNEDELRKTLLPEKSERSMVESEKQPVSMKVDHENTDKTSESDEQQDKEEKSSDKKRKRSPSPISEDAPRAPPIARPENEPNYDENAVLLSWYDSDLHLVINTINYFSASPMQGEGFNYMWAGARASHGFNKGKVFYEARVNTEFDNLAAQNAAGATNASGALPVDEEKIPSTLRVGWSTIGTSLQLGEDKLSYGYEGTGKKATDKVFSEYGKVFAKDDVVGCYADFETHEGTVILTFTVNGETQGPAFNIVKEELDGKALFPHVLSKNCSFTVNLGQEEAWSSTVLEGYHSVGKIDINHRIVGPRRPAKREDCEVILLCGLPFSGKTSWATKHVNEHSDKLYTVLGIHNLINKMRVEGLPLKDKFKGRWEVVEEKCSRALAKLLESAPSRRRNYILDQQANVYGSAQRRKMRNFYGFHRKAVVLIPSDEDFKARIAKCKEESGRVEIRESSILEYKANLSVPSIGESFEEVIWTDLEEQESKKLIETYNKEGKTAGYGNQQQQPSKRSRYDNGHKDRNHRDTRDYRRMGFNDRRSSSWRGGQSGWRDNRIRGPMRHVSSGYGAPAAWRGRGGDRRQDDRRQGGDRSRGRQGWNTTGYQGQNWGNHGNWQSQAQDWSNNWSQQQAWGGAGGAWKGYGQQQVPYGQQTNQNYDNGSWTWGSQYYNQQYWSGQPAQQAQHTTTGQTSGQTQQSSITPATSKK